MIKKVAVLLDFIKKFLGFGSDSITFNKAIVKKKYHKSGYDVNFVTPTFDLNGENVVHPEGQTEKEIEDLYAEIRVLQTKNREKLNKNKISYNLR